MSNVMEILREYSADTVILALVINVLTALIKKPIKIIAKKRENPQRITKFIVFVPIIAGFFVNLSYAYIFPFAAKLNQSEFYSLWLSSTSLALAFYAFAEKFIHKKENENESANSSDLTYESVIAFMESALKQYGLIKDNDIEGKTSKQLRKKIIIKENKNDEVDEK